MAFDISARAGELLKHCRRLTLERFRDLTELDHLHAALASFHLRLETLIAVQTGGKFDLRAVGNLAGRDKEMDEFLMPLGEDRR